MSRFTIAPVIGAILLSSRFIKSVRNTHRAHAEYDWSVYVLATCVLCKFQSFWKSNPYLFRNGRVKIVSCFVERKFHAVWKCLLSSRILFLAGPTRRNATIPWKLAPFSHLSVTIQSTEWQIHFSDHSVTIQCHSVPFSHHSVAFQYYSLFFFPYITDRICIISSYIWF